MCRLTFQDASILGLLAQLHPDDLDEAKALVSRLSPNAAAISRIILSIRSGGTDEVFQDDHHACAKTFLAWAEELHPLTA